MKINEYRELFYPALYNKLEQYGYTYKKSRHMFSKIENGWQYGIEIFLISFSRAFTINTILTINNLACKRQYKRIVPSVKYIPDMVRCSMESLYEFINCEKYPSEYHWVYETDSPSNVADRWYELFSFSGAVLFENVSDIDKMYSLYLEQKKRKLINAYQFLIYCLQTKYNESAKMKLRAFFLDCQNNLIMVSEKVELPSTSMSPSYEQFTEICKILLALEVIRPQEIDKNAVLKSELFYEKNREILVFD